MLDKQYPVVHSAGINKDRSFQDGNDVTFALNAIRDNHEGGRVEYQSEPGNQISVNLPEGYFIVGSIYGQNEEVYILSTDEINSEIGIFKNDTYITLANLNLGFSTKYPITGEYRVRNGCERTIYWCDYNKTDYWFNIDQPDDFKTSGVFDPNKFKLVPIILPIKVDLVAVNDFGGILPLGSYQFQPEILDNNLNSIYIGEISPQVIVYDESQFSDYSQIDGGLNIEQYDPAIGGVPVTNKSITLNFYNLNTTFKYLRINVFRTINGTQVIDGHTVGNLVEIGADSINWTYQGYNTSAGDYPIDVSEKLVDNIIYESAYVSEQVQGRLVRANLKQSSIDYTNYQYFASRITAKWVASEVKNNDAFEIGNPKCPQTYWTKRGFQGDECYLPGIQFIHTNGIISPVFPMIGRNSNSSDLTLQTVVTNSAVLAANEVWLSDVEHLGLEVGDTVPKWKVFNTAYLTDVQLSTHPYTYEGEFSFYESDETYPDIQDCDGISLWGTDVDEINITTDTKVRLFKFPDRRLVSHISTNGEYTVPFGIKFDNIAYPNSDVIGHRFVFADRTEFDKTVVDSGWSVTPLWSTGEQSISLNENGSEDNYKHFIYTPSDIQSTYWRFNSSKTLYESSLSSFSYYKTNRVHKFVSGLLGSSLADYASRTYNGGLMYSMIGHMNNNNSNLPFRTNHLEQQSFYITPGPINVPAQGLVPKVRTRDYYTSDSVSKVSYGLEDTTPLLGTQMFKWTYNDPSDTEFEFHNFYTYKKTLVQPYSNLLTRTYKSINHNYISSIDTEDNVFYGGDTLIVSPNTFRANGTIGSSISTIITLHYHHFEEQQINAELRHLGTSVDNKYFKEGDDDQFNFVRFIDPVTHDFRDTKDIIKEYYSRNKDFDLTQFQKAKSPLPLQFNYCSMCSGFFPNRIIFSPKSFDEEKFDLYRINKVNDYIDMPAHRGAITGLKYQNNQLLVHMEDSTFILQPNPQQISTDQNTAYLTTGDFLSVPPQELLQTDVGTAGLQSKQSMCNTPFGHCWVDQKRGEIFKWNGQIESMSSKGLTQWFKEKLPSELQSEYYRVLGRDYPLKSTLNINGIGNLLYYDPRFKRLLLTKRDFYPLNLKINFEDFPGHSISNGSFYQEETNEWYTLNNGDPEIIYPQQPEWFENKSWTLSYSFQDQSWCSWHSYIPWYSFADSNNFYTTSLSLGHIYVNTPIWKHLSKNNYQKYYNTKYDFIIEWQNMDPVTSNVSNIYYVGYSQIWDSVNKQFKTVDTTFNKILVYNFEQSSGLQTLTLENQNTNPYGNTSLFSSTKSVIKTDQNYKIAGIYDMAIAQPVMTEDWNQRQLFTGYIDLVPNSTNINFNKSPYDWGNIWDKFVNIRLYYKPTEDHKKSVLLQVLNSQQSIR